MSSIVTAIEKEFIFNQIIKTKGNVLMFGPGKHAHGRIKGYTKEFLVLDANPRHIAVFAPWEQVSVYCNYLGQRLTFPAKIRKIENGSVYLHFPEKLLKGPQRRGIRVSPPHNISLEFFMSNQHVSINYPESCEFIDNEMPEMHEGLDSGSIAGLMESFKQKAGMFAAVSGVIMFQDPRVPETIEEKLIAHYGRVLLIPSTRSNLPAEDPYPEGRIITQSMADAYEGPSLFLEGSMLEKSRLEKAEAGIISELFCPILFYQYVIGFVYMKNDETTRLCMDYKSLDFAWEFSRILAYQLQVHDYFKLSGKKPDPYRPAVIDLSPGGCLIGLPKASFTLQLKQNAGLQIRIHTEEKNYELKAKVVRRFSDPTTAFYGLCFTGIDEAMRTELKSLLYADTTNAIESSETEFSLNDTL